MDEILATLRLDTNALGIWLLGPMMAILDHHDRCEVLAAAVADASIEPPANLLVAGETYVDLGDRKLFAFPLAGATLVCLFDKRSSLGLMRLRVRKVKSPLEKALAERRR